MRRFAPAPVAAFAALLLLAACGGGESDRSGDVAAFTLPVTTASDSAERHFRLGLHDLDMGRAPEARTHFTRAVELDSTFALAHRYRVFVMPTTEASMAALSEASAHKASASEAEQAMIGMTEAAVRNDAGRQLELARQLTDAHAGSPRAWMQLAGVLAGMDS
ncbi:MAG: hypothetical protein R3266_12795, partial [Gemmatimonadota bacterium]|nr:hypothetical protein [Gemmatimonadota bacterium]